MFGIGIVFSHVSFDVTRTAEDLAVEANPVLSSVFALIALELREMLSVFIEEKLDQFLDLFVLEMRTVEFGLDREPGLLSGGFERHWSLK